MQRTKQAILVCSSCGQKNRVEVTRHDAVCGRCANPLSLELVRAVDQQSFQAVIEKSDIPVLVDFWAPWCGPCRMISPMLQKLAQEYKGQLLVVKVNTDEQERLAARYSIRALPTLALFSDGQEVDRKMGALPMPQMKRWLDQHL